MQEGGLMFGWGGRGEHHSLFIFYVYGSIRLCYFCCRGISRRWTAAALEIDYFGAAVSAETPETVVRPAPNL